MLFKTKQEEPIKQIVQRSGILNNPFLPENVIGIWVNCHRPFDDLNNDMSFRGTVEFKSGNTIGKQEFEGISMNHVWQQIERFLENL